MATSETQAKPKTVSVSTKVTVDQFLRYQAATGGLSLSEWVRETLDHALEREPVEREMLRRLALIEKILLNVAADLSAGVTITTDRVRQYRESLQ